MYKLKRSIMNLTNTNKDMDKILNKFKTLKEESNNLLPKILDLVKNWMVHNKILDCQHNNNKNSSLNLVNTNNNYLKIMPNHKPTDKKYKNF